MFKCSWCSRSWASAHVQVVFHVRWIKKESKGQVKMRVFAQRCQKCVEPPFEAPEFTEENTSRILNNLVLRILKKCYREGFKSMAEIPTIKDISLEGPHDIKNCEACLQGFCEQSGLDLAKQSPMSPSLPTISKPTFGIPTGKPSFPRTSSIVDAVTEDIRVKKGKELLQPWLSELSRAESLRANTSHVVEIPTSKPSLPRTSTIVDVVTGDTRVKKGEAPLHPWLSEPSRAESPRANTSHVVEIPTSKPSLPSMSTIVDVVTGDTRVKKGKELLHPWLSELLRAESPRANTSHVVEIPTSKPSLPRMSTIVNAVTGDTRVKKGKVPLHPWLSEPSRAKSPRANTSHVVEIPTCKPSLPRTSTIVDVVTGDTRVKKGKVPLHPWLSEPRRAESPRANTNYRVESIGAVSSPRKHLYSHAARNRRCCYSRICCLTILTLIIVAVVVTVVKITI
ncbi:PREDICTED: receptor-transporting protein 3 isoform X2 [Miniopterus natalensis]|uniref:receptor-transporting protein 3 isoform X2 n=1 Tax=Miniopterus natalensis TaxID=291302 RepID=UPI0007A6D029|nr:PREDICTED: receptor-transporting protein 3 isoform X2 [Miniopterus natalensis]